MFLYLLQDEPGCEEINCSEGECENLPSVFPFATTEPKSAIETCHGFPLRNIRATVGATGVFKVVMTAFHWRNILSQRKPKSQLPMGRTLTTYWGITKEITRKRNCYGFFTNELLVAILNQEITWLLPFALHHPAHSELLLPS